MADSLLQVSLESLPGFDLDMYLRWKEIINFGDDGHVGHCEFDTCLPALSFERAKNKSESFPAVRLSSRTYQYPIRYLQICNKKIMPLPTLFRLATSGYGLARVVLGQVGEAPEFGHFVVNVCEKGLPKVFRSMFSQYGTCLLTASSLKRLSTSVETYGEAVVDHLGLFDQGLELKFSTKDGESA